MRVVGMDRQRILTKCGQYLTAMNIHGTKKQLTFVKRTGYLSHGRIRALNSG